MKTIDYLNQILNDPELCKKVMKDELNEVKEKLSFPSLYEGFGMPIIEALAVGRPVVTSNRSPMQDLAAGSAVLVNPHLLSLEG